MRETQNFSARFSSENCGEDTAYVTSRLLQVGGWGAYVGVYIYIYIFECILSIFIDLFIDVDVLILIRLLTMYILGVYVYVL